MSTLSHSAWLIDLDGTLYHAAPLRLLMAVELATLGWGAIPTLRAFRAAHEHLRHHPEDCASNPFAAQIKRVAQLRGLPEDQVLSVVKHWMIERPCKWLKLCERTMLMREIAAFRARGGRTAMVSDYPALEKLRALGAADLFDAIISVGEPGGPSRLKPNPEGYLLAASALQTHPAQCLVLGDRLDADGAAASAAGMAFRLIR